MRGGHSACGCGNPSVLSFRTRVRPEMSLRLHALGDALRQAPQDAATARLPSARSVSNVVSAEMLFIERSGVTLPASSPRDRRARRSPIAAVAPRELRARRSSAAGRSSGRRPAPAAPACALPTPQIIDTGCAREERQRLGAADDGEAARLVEVRGDLGEELVVAEPDRDGDAELALDPLLEAGERRRPAARRAGARCRRGRGTPRRCDSGSTSGRQRAASASRTCAADARRISPCSGGSPPRPDRPSAP